VIAVAIAYSGFRIAVLPEAPKESELKDVLGARR
jgi:hypothetical protein